MKTVQHYIYRLLAGVTLPLLLWSVTACTADRGERLLEGETYLAVPLRGNSINTDQQLFEDKVGNVTMLVFPVGRMECTANVRVDAPKAGTVSKIQPTKVLQGMNDLYFIANVPDDTELSDITSRAQIEDYLYKVRSFTADPEGKGLPMARVYRNQMIGEGTVDAPFMFKPNTEGNNTPFVPVSNFDLNSLKVTDTKDVVGLVRSCAKISVTFTGEGVNDIESVQCYNVAQNFSFAQLPEETTYQQISEPQDITIHDVATSTNTKEGHIYVPERLFKSTEMPKWSANKNKITYVKLQMKSGRELLIPIAHNASEALADGSNYLQFVTGEKAGKKAGKDNLKPDFNIVRNMHYLLRVKLSSDAKQVDVSLQVMPWTLVASSFFYTRPQYTIKVETPEGVQPLSKIGTDILLHDTSEATITFTIQEPQGGLWVATLTNALEYELEGERSGVIYPGAKAYKMQIKPKAGFENKPRYTQFFITVNGREIYLGDLNKVPEGDGKGRFFDEVTPAKRWQFKQVE